MKTTALILTGLFLAFTFIIALEVDDLTVNEALIISQGEPWSVSNNLVAHWHMNDNTNTTTVVDSSTEGNTGTLNGGDNTDDKHVTGKVGTGALTLNGTDDYIAVADDNSLDFGTGSFSISAWIKLDDLNHYHGIVIKRHSGEGGSPQFTFRVDHTTGYLRLSTYYNGSSTVVSDTALTADTWYYVVAVRNSNGSHELWINGELDNSSSLTVRNVTNGQPLWIGDDNRDYGTSYFKGTIDELLIVDKALSTTEIEELYNDGAGMEETTGSTSAPAVVEGLTEFEDGATTPQKGDVSMGIYTNTP